MRYLPHTRRGGILKSLLLVIAGIVLLLLLVLGFEFYLGATAKPTIPVNYTQRIHDARLERQRAANGPGLNQHPLFEEHMVFIRSVNEQAVERWIDASSDPADPWAPPSFDLMYTVPEKGTREQFAAAQRLVREGLEFWRDQGVFARSAELATLERLARPPFDGPVFQWLLPHLGAARMLARAQAARAHVAAERGDADDWLTAIEEMFVIARHIEGMGALIDYLVGVAIRSLARTALLETMLKHGLHDASTLDRIEAVVHRELINSAVPMERVLNNERAFVDDIIQRSFTDNGNGNGRFIPLAFSRLMGEQVFGSGSMMLPLGDNAASNIHGRLFFDRREATEWADAQWALYIESAAAQGADAVALDRKSESAAIEQDWRNPITSVISNYTRTIMTSRVDRIQTQGLLVLLAIERYRLQHGDALPQTLDDLGDLLPEQLRTDPFIGQPWDYQPTPRTLDASEQPLREGALAWPYTLGSRGLRGMEPDRPSERNNHAYYGVLITQPIQGSKYDKPWPDSEPR